MVAFEDLTGQVFGMLTVLKLDITKNRNSLDSKMFMW